MEVISQISRNAFFTKLSSITPDSEANVHNLSMFLVAVGTLMAVGCLLALWRFGVLREKGIPTIVRALPAADGSGWRHGVIIYSDSSLKFYKLRSLRPTFDVQFARHDVEIMDRRNPSSSEASIFDPSQRVVRISTTSQGEWELALDSSGDTALVAWVESSPSVRQTRALPTNIDRTFDTLRARSRNNP